jgi:N-alpha-acetyl-L-2,4-diaminobutyrate deacetylase
MKYTLPNRVSCSINLKKEGKQVGFFSAPYSSNNSAWGSVQIPIVSIKNGRGKKILFVGGNHGDEYEGQISLIKLIQKTGKYKVNGQIIIIPSLNFPAVESGDRVSPLDGLNMNRIFPGKWDGSVSEMIADFLQRQILPYVNVVVDLHSGGKTLDLLPLMMMHKINNSKIYDETKKAMLAFNAPISLIFEELDMKGMLDKSVEDMGKIFLSAELGGGGNANIDYINIADEGLVNILRHFKIFKNIKNKNKKINTILLETPDKRSFIISEDQGMIEYVVPLGTYVRRGEIIASIYNYKKPATKPIVYKSKMNGIVFMQHFPGLISRGDCLAVIGDEIEV